MSKFMSKLSSDFIVNTLCAITLGAGVAEYSTNVFLNDLYVKYFKEAYKNGQPVPLSESLRKRFNDVTNDVKLTDFQKTFSIPFAAEGLNPVNVGCVNYRFGCFIGIPSIYDLNSINDISNENVENLAVQDNILLMNDNSKHSQEFMESLILSESAKKYSIARELILTDNSRILFKSISYTITLLPMYALGSTIIGLLPIKVRVLAFFLLCNLGVFFWLLIRAAIENFYQHDADEKVSDIGEEYIYGGIEYYEKLIQRNLALRNIVPDGEKIYSENGNKLEFIPLCSGLSLTLRKKYLEHKLKNHKD